MENIHKITKPDKIGEEKTYLLEINQYHVTKSEYFIDLIFKKLKAYKEKKIFLEKEDLKKFIFSLLKDN